MKSLKEFKSSVLSQSNLSLVYGGNWVSSGNTTSTDSNGCAVHTSESFNDTNGDGVRQGGESVLMCTSVKCSNY